jgi:hypothetical protein
MVLASLASMNNISAPVADVCPTRDRLVDAWTSSLQAECIASSRPWSQDLEMRCSTFGNGTCIYSNRHTVVNFTTGSVSACSQAVAASNGEPHCPLGDFAVIFGEWVAGNDAGDGNNLTTTSRYTVDCRVSYGTVNIKQNSSGSEVERSSFVKSTTPIGDPGSLASLWQDRFTSEGGLANSPYTFAYTTWDMNTMTALSRYLIALGTSHGSDQAAKVGQTIEANFDMTTLFAFARVPQAADVHTLRQVPHYYWSYDFMVLCILAVPFLATVFVLSTHWRVQSDEVMLGYNPVLIARRADDILASSIGAEEDCSGELGGESISLEKVGRHQSMV